ncbi:MAG: hypothetical protein CVV25_12035 [Ignavibacteriae bacterium HGW-Ignavibacteriae-4]|nr:MAG: hypothetical protein CVV25_12035 [Ignavibacteriae bacterium HGW-Ignavibacteriae-4]
MKSLFTPLMIVFLSCYGNLYFAQSQTFENIFPKAGIEHFTHDGMLMAGGVVVLDYNNDGYDDFILIGGDEEKTRIFRNNPSAYKTKPYDYTKMFTDVTDQIMYIPDMFFIIGGGSFDFDNDGWEDVFFTTDRGQSSLVYRNVNGKFEEAGSGLGFTEKFQSTSVSFGDVNLDGWIDVYVANYFEDQTNQVCLPNSLYINHGGKFFTEEALVYAVNDRGCGLANTFSDFDNDGDMDLFVANDFGQNFASNALYRNEYPDKTFLNVKDKYGFNNAILGMGVEGGDYNNDGWFDYYATNLGQNFFYENAKGQAFLERGKELKIDNTKANPKSEQSGNTVSWSANWFDYDLDMDVDLHVTNGYLAPLPDINTEYADNNRLFRNNGDGVAFSEVTEEEGMLSAGLDRGAAQIDFDNDGDMDLITSVVRPDKTTTPYNDKDFFKLFENKQNTGRNWLKIKLEGSTIDRLAMGSRVKVYTGKTTQMREVTSGGGGYLSQGTRYLQFGLMNNQTVDSVVVLWTGHKIKSTLRNVNSNQTIKLIQPYMDTVKVEICEDEELFGKKWVGYGEYRDTVVAKNGADSNLVYQIFVNKIDRLNINVDVCKGKEFEGQLWDQPGEKVVNYLNKKGCDSIVTYKVAILQPYASIVDTSICYGSYFQGKEYIENSSFERSFVASNGCDSSIKYNITVLEAPNFTENFDVCYGDIFRGKIIVKREIFTESFKSNKNCDSVHTIVVDPLAESKRRDSVYLNAGDEYKGKQYFEDGLYVNKIKGGAFNGCDSLYIADIFVTKSSIFNSIDNNKLNIEIIPNPFAESTTIEFDIDSPLGTSIELINQIGQTIPINERLSVGRNRINLNSDKYRLIPGVYFLKINTNGNSYISKIVKGN